MERIQIYDLMGRLAKEWIPTDSYQTRMSTKTLSQGTYLVKVQSNEGTWTKRLVVIK